MVTKARQEGPPVACKAAYTGVSLMVTSALVQKVTNTAMRPVAIPTMSVIAHRLAARLLWVVHHLPIGAGNKQNKYMKQVVEEIATGTQEVRVDKK